jgi:glycosyltransferase involved in cell wall biosynthesis
VTKSPEIGETMSTAVRAGTANSVDDGMAAMAAPHGIESVQMPKRICMVAYSHFHSDARVTRYAETLAARGDQVDVIALKRSKGEAGRETRGNITLVRFQTRAGKKEKSPLSFLLPVLRFLFVSSIWIARQHCRKPYDVIHIHNVPDFLVFAAWYPKLMGAKIILDIHDIVPEFYESKFGADRRATIIKLLKRLERASAAFADHVIISNHLWRDKYSARTGAHAKCSVLINNVDVRIFHPRPRTRNDGRIIIIFPGGLQWHQGLDIAIRAFQRVSAELPQAEFHIYGEGDMKGSLTTLAGEMGLQKKVKFFAPLPVREIAELMAQADLGVVPKRADSFGNEAYSTKIMEFLAVGTPVVVSGTKIDRYYFNDSVVKFFESGDEQALADAILEVLGNESLRRALTENARDYVSQNSWDSKRPEYLRLVDSLC